MTDQQLSPLALVKSELPTLEKILSLSARPGTNLAIIAAQELSHLEAIAQTKPELSQCTPQSVLLAVKAVMQKNLTLDPYAGLVYVQTRSVNIGTEAQKKWVKVLEMTPTANGLISINRQLGRILDYTNPKVQKDATGKVIGVSMDILKPTHGGASRWERYEYDESDFKRWRIASHRDRSRNKADANATTLNYANHMYTSWEGGIDPEFARAKCIKHSLKKLGTNPQENARVVVYDVPAERIIDPEKDEYMEPDASGNVYVDHEEISTKPATPPSNIDLPNDNEL